MAALDLVRVRGLRWLLPIMIPSSAHSVALKTLTMDPFVHDSDVDEEFFAGVAPHLQELHYNIDIPAIVCEYPL